MLPASSQALYPSLPHRCESSLTPLLLLSPQNFVLWGPHASRILSDEQILISSVSAQNPPVLLPPKRVCLCSRSHRQPLSDVSGQKRYNTLDFPAENRVPTGMLLAPIGNPEPKGLRPSEHPHIFLENGTQTVKMQFDTFPQKIQNRCNLHPCEDENYSGLLYCRLFFPSFSATIFFYSDVNCQSQSKPISTMQLS